MQDEFGDTPKSRIRPGIPSREFSQDSRKMEHSILREFLEGITEEILREFFQDEGILEVS